VKYEWGVIIEVERIVFVRMVEVNCNDSRRRESYGQLMFEEDRLTGG
jgi:hypothetical protein